MTNVTLADPDGVGSQTAPATSYEYDNLGRLIIETDSLGQRTDYRYDVRSRLIRVIGRDRDGDGPKGRPWTTYSYDAAGQLTSVQDPAGLTTSYTYGVLGRLNKITEPDPDGSDGIKVSPVTSYGYDNVGNLLTVTDPLNHATNYAYDAAGRVTSVADPLGNATSYGYDAAGNLASVTDALDRTTSYAYDNIGRLTSVTNALNGVNSFSYDAAGNLLSESDELNRTTSYAYDGLSRLTSTTDPLGNVTSYGFDAVGNMVKLTLPDPDGSGAQVAAVTSYTYDGLNRLTRITDALGGIESFGYDALDRMTSQTDQMGRTTSYAYNTFGPEAGGSKVSAVTDPLGNTTTYGYNVIGWLGRVTQPDPDGSGAQTASVTTHSYDNLGRLVTTTDAQGYQTAYDYDAAGNLKQISDLAGNAIHYWYDAADRVVQESHQIGWTRYFNYDKVGNLTKKTDRNGRVIQYTYDALDRVTEEKWLVGTAIHEVLSFSYDAASQLTGAAGWYFWDTFHYDAAGRMTHVSAANSYVPNSPNVTMTSVYDDLGRRTSVMATRDGVHDFKNAYLFDALSRTTRISQFDAAPTAGATVREKRVDLAYNAAGQFTTIDRYADFAGTNLVASTLHGYDGEGKWTSLWHTGEPGITFGSIGWEYDNADRLVRFGSVGSTVYSYDKTAQLLGADHTKQEDESYTYDGRGNRTNPGYETGTGNRLLTDGQQTYEYDTEGNRTRKTSIATGAYMEYMWDHRNRLTVVNYKSSAGAIQKQVHYKYDAFDRRIAKQVDDDGNGTFDRQYRYVYDGEDVVLVYDETGSVTNRYLHGPEVDQVFADENALGEVLWGLTDNQGTVRRVLDAGGQRNYIEYDSFGNITSELNPDVEFAYAYTGREWDADVGLYYYRARWYDAVVGRFLSEDPIGFEAGDPNLYRYVGNSPTNFTDPSGHELFTTGQAARDQVIRWIESEIGITPVTAPLGGTDAYFITFAAKDRSRLARRIELQQTLSGREFDGFDSKFYDALFSSKRHYLVQCGENGNYTGEEIRLSRFGMNDKAIRTMVAVAAAAGFSRRDLETYSANYVQQINADIAAANRLGTGERILAGVQGVAGLAEMGIAGTLAYGSGGLATAGAYALALYGADQTVAGFTGAFTGRATRTLGSRVFDPLTGTAAYSETIYGLIGAAGSARATQSILARQLWAPLGLDCSGITGLAPTGTRAVLEGLPGKLGKTGPIKEVPDAKTLDNLFDSLSSGGKTVNPGTYRGVVKELPDGTIIRRRPGSKSGGATLDITMPDGTYIKVHIKK